MISTLQISNLRNLTQVSLSPSRCNLLIGDNGSGKTSLLESIFLLSRGKSFRSHQPKRYIQHQQPSATVFVRFDDEVSLAIQKQTDATTLLRLNGEVVKTQYRLTQYMPTLLIDPSSMEVLEQGSANRRQLLDWLAFHVQAGFYPQWLAYQRLLKQRNSLLKQIKFANHLHRQQIEAWDNGLTTHAELIHYYRQQVFEAWLPHFQQCLQQLLPSYAEQISVSYHAGFDTDIPLNETLAQRLEQDIHQGYTRVGSHRADIHVHWQGEVREQAVNVLSRGEKKLLITALRLSQLPLLQATEQATEQTTDSIVLIDDITSELDDHAIKVVLSTLASLSCQVFITSLTDDIVPLVKEYWQEYQVFGVKEGQITKTP